MHNQDMAQVRRVVVYLEPADYERLRKAAGIIPVSAYARSVILASLPAEGEIPVADAGIQNVSGVSELPVDGGRALPVEPLATFEQPPIERTLPIQRRECEHGIMEGYNCWRCRGPAVVRKRVQGRR